MKEAHLDARLCESFYQKTKLIAILAIGMVTAPVFADSDSIKIQNKQNIHNKCDGFAGCVASGEQSACHDVNSCTQISN